MKTWVASDVRALFEDADVRLRHVGEFLLSVEGELPNRHTDLLEASTDLASSRKQIEKALKMLDDDQKGALG